MGEKGCDLKLTREAKELIVENGYDPTLGARPLRRSIQRMIEDPLAEGFLSGDYSDNSLIRIGRTGKELKFTIEPLGTLSEENPDEVSV